MVVSRACKNAPVSERVKVVLAGSVVVAAVGMLFRPALGFTLIGDDYQWLQLARAALRHPGLLLADLDGFWRPSSTWLLALTELLRPGSAAAHHAVNLVLRGLAGLLLLVLARRLDLSVVAAAAIAVLWVASPFAAEPAFSVACRHEDLLLLGWLVMAVAWPGADGRWSPGRLGVAVSGALLAACSKETWVMTPALAAVLEVGRARRTWRQALRVGAVWALPVAVYIVAHLVLLPGREYYSFAWRVLAKVPHQLAAFWYLEGLVPLQFPFSWKGLLALGLTAGAVWVARHRAAGWVGLALLVLPTVPTLFVPYLPTRYTAIPYAGFLVLVAAATASLVDGLAATRRRLAVVGAGVVVVLVLVAGMSTVRGDLDDIGRVSAAHARLLAEAQQAAPAFPAGVPVVHVRVERDSPLGEIAGSPRGLPKLLYPRHQDPYGLIDVAALFDFVLAGRGLEARLVQDGDPRLQGPGSLLVHRTGGFAWQPAPAPLARAMDAARAQGTYARALIATPYR